MSLENGEKDPNDISKNLRPKQSPHGNSKEEVRLKANAPRKQTGGFARPGIIGFLILALAVAIGLIFHFAVSRSAKKPRPAEKVPLVPVEVPAEPGGTTVGSEYEELARDLFILEVLGEDEGLLDDRDRLASDADFLPR